MSLIELVRCLRRLSTRNLLAGTKKSVRRGEKEREVEGQPKGAPSEGNLPPVRPQGNLVEVLGRELRPEGNSWWRAPLPARGSHHVKPLRGC